MLSLGLFCRSRGRVPSSTTSISSLVLSKRTTSTKPLLGLSHTNCQPSNCVLRSSIFPLLSQSYSTMPLKPTPLPSSPSSSPSLSPHTKHSTTNQESFQDEMPTVSLRELFQGISRPVKFIVIGAVTVFSTMETIFWFRMLKAKFFPDDSDDQEAVDAEKRGDS